MATIPAGTDITTYDLDFTGQQVNTAINTILNTDFTDLATRAEAAATGAEASATAATSSVNEAAASKQDAEAWAVGEINGTPVSSADERYHNNAKYYAEIAASTVSGVAAFNGRSGIVEPASGDYSADMVGAVALPASPTLGDILTWDGTAWVADTIDTGTTLIVTATTSGSSFSTDYSYSDIIAALDSGRTVILKNGTIYYPLIGRSGSTAVIFGGIMPGGSNSTILAGRKFYMTSNMNIVMDMTTSPVFDVQIVTSSINIGAEDTGYCLSVTASSDITLTITDGVENDEIEIVRCSTGAVTIVASSADGMSLNGVSGGSVTLNSQWDSVRIKAITSTNWIVVNDQRGIDTAPVQNSTDLITSGGVYSALASFTPANVATLDSYGKVTPSQASSTVFSLGGDITLSSNYYGALLTADDSYTITLPTGVTAGTEVEVMLLAAGKTVTIQAASGVTINGVSGGSVQLTEQYKSIVLKHLGSSESWVAQGAIA